MRAILDDPPVGDYLRELAGRAAAILGDRLVGAWLINSGARDDYVPGRSDLDVLVAVSDRLLVDERRGLADALRHASLACPAPRLELVVYRRGVLADPGPRPDWELNVNTGPAIRRDHVGTDAAREPAHWFVLDLAMAREAARTLVGPPLGGLVGPIHDAVIIQALQASVAWHEANDAAAPNRVLNACRAWRWLEERRWSSKTEAAAWAIERGADADLVEMALASRRGEHAGPLPVDRVAALVARVTSLLAAGDPRAGVRTKPV